MFDISDNGPGFPQKMGNELPDSLGFRIIKVLSMQIGGTHSYYNNNGATHHLSFKLPDNSYD